MDDLKDSKVFYKDKFIPMEEANLSVASSAVLYGLSVYTVFQINSTTKGPVAFRLKEHYERLINSAHIIGIDTFAPEWSYDKFLEKVKELVKINNFKDDVFVRASVHVTDIVPGTKSRGLNTILTMFAYPCTPIVPQDGCRLKTSLWRRIPDNSIPARAKVNGAYVNSVLAKQDALDSGYDDCIFLDLTGHVCEASAANIFIARDGVLITPDKTSDLLEGISRKTVIEIAENLGIKVEERPVDLTELYIADEVFLCGTSSHIAFVNEVDARHIKSNQKITKQIQKAYTQLTHSYDSGLVERL